jgi:hypothetical protein
MVCPEVKKKCSIRQFHLWKEPEKAQKPALRQRTIIHCFTEIPSKTSLSA